MALNGAVHNNGQDILFLTAAGLALTTAVTATTTTPVKTLAGMRAVVFTVRFVYGSGGTTLKIWLQTTFDAGTSWCDIACLAHATASLNRIVTMSQDLYFTNSTDHPIPSPVQPYTPTDGTLADDTFVQGMLGSQLRLKYTSTGTYASTTVFASAVVKG